MNNEQLREILVDKYDYKNAQVDDVVAKINGFAPDIAAAFYKWLETGEIDGTESEGYTVEKIMELKPMKVVSAYITLNHLRLEPERIKHALNKKIYWSSDRKMNGMP
jgi:hypothetical protein